MTSGCRSGCAGGTPEEDAVAAAEKALRAALDKRLKQARARAHAAPAPLVTACCDSRHVFSPRPSFLQAQKWAHPPAVAMSASSTCNQGDAVWPFGSSQAKAKSITDLLPAHVVAAAAAAAARLRSVRVNTLKATVDEAKEALREALPGAKRPPPPPHIPRPNLRVFSCDSVVSRLIDGVSSSQRALRSRGTLSSPTSCCCRPGRACTATRG